MNFQTVLGGAAIFAGVAGGATVAGRLTGAGGSKALDAGAGVAGGATLLAALKFGKSLPGAARGALIAGGAGLIAASALDAVIGGSHAAAGTPVPTRNPTPVPEPVPPATGPVTGPNPQQQLLPGDQLPDGEQFQPPLVELDGKTLRFDSMVANTGQAPLEMALKVDASGTPTSTDQVIFNADQSKRSIPIRGSFERDDRGDHNHLHFNDFVYFQLYKADARGKAVEGAARGVGKASGGQLAAGIKQSFFITDVQQVSNVPAANRAAADRLEMHGQFDPTAVPADTLQGISVGAADVYGASLDGQSLDVGNLAPGKYVLRQTFDPNDEMVEMDERNNSRDVLIKVTANHQVSVVGSKLVDKARYETLPDGRTVVPSVVNAMLQTAAAGGSESKLGTPIPHAAIAAS